MTRRSFYSFHYIPDNWRAGQVRSMGVIEGNRPVSDNDWEQIKRGGDSAIRRWIDDQMHGKSCIIVLAGSATAGRKWINYEIEKGWNDGKGVVGIHIHSLLNSQGQQSTKGANPFASFTLRDGRRLSSVAKCYDPPYSTSQSVYGYIKDNLAAWVDEAVEIRQSS